jgi:hypothetical protein
MISLLHPDPRNLIYRYGEFGLEGKQFSDFMVDDYIHPNDNGHKVSTEAPCALNC